MSTVTVVYTGRCEAVESPDGTLFVRGERVSVPADVSETLGGDFEIIGEEAE